MWDIKSVPGKVVEWFLELSDECLGSGDIDYLERDIVMIGSSSMPATPISGKTPSKNVGSSKKKASGGVGRKSGSVKKTPSKRASEGPAKKPKKRRKRVIGSDSVSEESSDDNYQ